MQNFHDASRQGRAYVPVNPLEPSPIPYPWPRRCPLRLPGCYPAFPALCRLLGGPTVESVEKHCAIPIAARLSQSIKLKHVRSSGLPSPGSTWSRVSRPGSRAPLNASVLRGAREDLSMEIAKESAL